MFSWWSVLYSKLSAASGSCSQHTDVLKGSWVDLWPTLTRATSGFQMCVFVIVFFYFKTGKVESYVQKGKAATVWFLLLYSPLVVAFICFIFPDAAFLLSPNQIWILSLEMLFSCYWRFIFCPHYHVDTPPTIPAHDHLSSSHFIHQEIVSCPPSCSRIKINSWAQKVVDSKRSHLGNRHFSTVKHM